jgi:hypothetical protein
LGCFVLFSLSLFVCEATGATGEGNESERKKEKSERDEGQDTKLKGNEKKRGKASAKSSIFDSVL